MYYGSKEGETDVRSFLTEETHTKKTNSKKIHKIRRRRRSFEILICRNPKQKSVVSVIQNERGQRTRSSWPPRSQLGAGEVLRRRGQGQRDRRGPAAGAGRGGGERGGREGRHGSGRGEGKR